MFPNEKHQVVLNLHVAIDYEVVVAFVAVVIEQQLKLQLTYDLPI